MRYILDIKGEIEGDYEIIGKYEERPKGKWLEDSGNIACTHCHTIWLYRKTDFCPNCGADMRGDVNA